MDIFHDNIIGPIIYSINKFGERNSFHIDNKNFTYADLGKYVSKIRAAIQKTSFHGTLIGLVTNDDIETYASILAIWLEGYAYVPLHPSHPVERGLEVINLAELDLIIDSSENLVFSICHTIKSKELEYYSSNLSTGNVRDDEIAYILFTSGSTGTPKGVPISRRNIGAFMKAFNETEIEIGENDRCLQCFDLTFDVSIQSFLVPLTKGACIYTIPHDQIKPTYAHALLEDHKLTMAVMAPSMIRFLKPYFDEIDLPDLKNLILTAEASTLSLVEEWSSCIPNAEIFDFYGPTEGTIYCTYSKFIRNGVNKHLNGLLTIGRPLNGIEAIIVDDTMELVSANHKGEFCISGDQVTSGYWKNPEKNLESFFEKEINGNTKKYYRTGDLCYFDHEGDIMYSGRIDYQVKIQGYRIELGEIEYHARNFLDGQNAVAVAYENGFGNNEIALFIEGIFDMQDDIKNYLKSKLPSYMIPSRIIREEVFPINNNDKVDRNVLKEKVMK